MVANTGWTWDHVLDTMTMPRLESMNEQWRIHPPTHWLVAAFVGYKPPSEGSRSARGAGFSPGTSVEQARSLMSQFNSF